ncbi:MAG: 2-phosphosulfolactate phosphatase [Planctomycetota bacterium]|jgi:2-phosphosulfolactate phosphatase
MGVSATFTPAEIEGRDVTGAAVVVIDCFRAATSVAVALEAGARAIYPFLSVQEARDEKARRPGALLAGERHAERPEGFDLGNSPREFRGETVRGREIIMTTTNGTRVITAASHAEGLFMCGFVNLTATAEAVLRGRGDVILACAGTAGRFSIEDALCAGLLAEKLARTGSELDDSAVFARAAADAPWADLREAAISGRGAAHVRRAGLERDLEDCLALDSLGVAAEIRKDPLRVVPFTRDAAAACKAPREVGGATV